MNAWRAIQRLSPRPTTGAERLACDPAVGDAARRPEPAARTPPEPMIGSGAPRPTVGALGVSGGRPQPMDGTPGVRAPAGGRWDAERGLSPVWLSPARDSAQPGT